MRHYRHFELLTACDWMDWRDGGCFRFELFRLDLTFSRDTGDGGQDITATLAVSLLGLGFEFTVGRWWDWWGDLSERKSS